MNIPSKDKLDSLGREDYTPHIEVIKKGKQWAVEFGIGNQFFELYYQGTKAEANWMKKMLTKAFKNALLIK